MKKGVFVLSGVPVLFCESCQFFCSDARYLKVHNVIDHAEVLKEFNPEESNTGKNIESAIEATTPFFLSGSRILSKIYFRNWRAFEFFQLLETKTP